MEKRAYMRQVGHHTGCTAQCTAQRPSRYPCRCRLTACCSMSGRLLPAADMLLLDCSTALSAVKGVLIGKVPDRGGRPEGRKREADMPEWKARQVSSLPAVQPAVQYKSLAARVEGAFWHCKCGLTCG